MIMLDTSVLAKISSNILAITLLSITLVTGIASFGMTGGGQENVKKFFESKKLKQK